ncbi:MAG: DUF1349 domain-containing protein [Chloroflexota bacterium]
MDLISAEWLNQPQAFEVTDNLVKIVTEPNTDFWQRSYYGFRNDNAPALLNQSAKNFTFTAKATFEYAKRFDQCGLIIYLDSENWFKASIEYETEQFSRLGSVVTNLGYSDWATTNISLPPSIWYRLSRRGPDFLIESSLDGQAFKQMRIFHLHQLGETTADMGKADPPIRTNKPIRYGLYACSPLNSSFTAVFEGIQTESCKWEAHK